MNELFKNYPPIIHGEARGEDDEFVIHTRFPKFLARRSFDDTFTGELPNKPISGELGRTEDSLVYKSNIGVWLSDLIVMENGTYDKDEFAAALLAACNKCIADLVMLDEETL